MKKEPRRDIFGYTALLRGIIIFGATICVWGFASEYAVDAGKRRAFVLYGFAALVLLCLIALAQVFRGRIELRADEIRVVELVGHKSYPRSTVAGARWEKGCPVSLNLRDGTWANLPDTGHANTKVAGAIRAWLNEANASGTGAAQQADEADEAQGGTRTAR
jgi:hypothetical protein